ncbi:MAG: NADH-quinone oxidoreductase subunit J [Chloroflexi bacterium]|nr:NADH-quinone oxidoreductase subunit J [Chloroflexota bacterium]
MDDTGTVVAFWILAAITVGAALGVAAVRNLIHSVALLIVTFAGVAGLYITLSADFIAVVQILIYIGAIVILILFAIVLTPRAGRLNQEGFMLLPAMVLAVLVAGTMIFVAFDTNWAISDRSAFEDTTTAIGDLLLDRYALPFEIASVLLLSAILGAILLVRPEGAEEEME